MPVPCLLLALLACFPVLLMAQTDPLARRWAAIEKLINEDRRPQTARDSLSRFRRTAEAQNRWAWVYRAVSLDIQLELQASDTDALPAAFLRWERTAAEARPELQPIYHTALARHYADHLQANRWQIYQRTAGAAVDTADLRTWDTRTLTERIDRHFDAALANPDVLARFQTVDWAPALVGEAAEYPLRPTLYDMLVHEALNYYRQDEPHRVESSKVLRIDRDDYYAPPTDFIEATRDIERQPGQSARVLALYRELARHHLQRGLERPLVLSTLDRLAWVQSQDTRRGESELLLLRALEGLWARHGNGPQRDLVALRLAQWLRTLGNKPREGENWPYRWYLKRAVEFCREQEAAGLTQLAPVRQLIETEQLHLQTEQRLLPDRPNLVSFTYRNPKTVVLRVWKCTADERLKLLQAHYRDEATVNLLKRIARRSPSHTFTFELPDAGDYQPRTTEVALPPLPPGHYLFSKDDTLPYEQTPVLDVGRYAVVASNAQPNDLFLRDALTGGALVDVAVRVECTIDYYNYDSQPYGRRTRHFSYETRTGPEGGFAFDARQNTEAQRLLQELEGKRSYANIRYVVRIDAGSPQEYVLSVDAPEKPYNVPVNAHDQYFLFSDRAIYRPGQVVYFKVIGVNRADENHSLLTDRREISVELIDPNGQQLESRTLALNEFGTAAGQFVLPTGGLRGLFQLRVPGASIASLPIQVEEYRRPKFEVKLSPPDRAVSLGQSVEVPGTAASFAGAPLAGARVRYTVNRQVRWPRWCWWLPPLPEAQVIATGETETDSEGRFRIPFVARPAETAQAGVPPIYTYRIEAVVVDATGETRDHQLDIRVGSLTVYPEASVPRRSTADDRELKVELQNLDLNGQPARAAGLLRIYRLGQPDEPQRKRYWPQPDTLSLSLDTYRRDFPHELPAAEIERLAQQGELIAEQAFDGAGRLPVVFKKNNQWKAGVYRLELLAQDAAGTPIEQRYDFTVEGRKGDPLPQPTFFGCRANAEEIEPGQPLRLSFETSLEGVHVLWSWNSKRTHEPPRWLRLSKGLTELQIETTAADTGTWLTVSMLALSHNRMFSQQLQARVRKPDRQLKFRWESFRSQLEPGKPETWRLRVLEPTGRPAAAEVLAAMYDASLDAFMGHGWRFVAESYYLPWAARHTAFQFGSQPTGLLTPTPLHGDETLDILIQLRLHYDALQMVWRNPYLMRARAMAAPSGSGEAPGLQAEMSDGAMNAEMAAAPKADREESEASPKEAAASDQPDEQKAAPPPLQVRRNLQETAFFYPQLRTDARGDVLIEFMAPDALTRWKVLLLAHTRELHHALQTDTVLTNKPLMVMPQLPRFVREGDEVQVSARIDNRTEGPLTGEARLELFDALTGRPVDLLAAGVAEQSFAAPARQGATVHWRIRIPAALQALTWRITAGNEAFADGEESVLPVLPNSMLVTETMPIAVRGKGEHRFTFAALKNDTSTTLRHERLTLEYTPNPVWYAVQALPYLMEFPHECAEQLFARFYANSLAGHIANQHPRITQVFRIWRDLQPEALLSNLEKDEHLKNILIEETPWLRQAQNQSEQKRRIGLLFDLNRMASEGQSALDKLAAMRLGNGAFPWFAGMPHPSYPVTLHIVTGLLRLEALGIDLPPAAREIVRAGLGWLDGETERQYAELKKTLGFDPQKNYYHVGIAHYFYARNRFEGRDRAVESREYYKFWQEQARTHWNKQGWYGMAYTALAFHPSGAHGKMVDAIVLALRENLIDSPEFGLRLNYTSGLGWYEAPIETQALIVEVFEAIARDRAVADGLKVWLLKQKQTTHWPTTKATVEACFALLLRGGDLLSEDNTPVIRWGGEVVAAQDTEAGTGHFQLAKVGPEVRPELAEVVVEQPTDGVSWGALYWQYFEQLDKIKFAQTPARLRRSLYRRVNTAEGPRLEAFDATQPLHPGDEVVVRLELYVDRDLDFVHVKDLRAAGLEPLEVLSGYRHGGDLGWYQSTRDVATHFFFDRLPKGKHVLEYRLRAFSAGDFSAAPCFLQSMYAPEFTAHSAGSRLRIEGK